MTFERPNGTIIKYFTRSERQSSKDLEVLPPLAGKQTLWVEGPILSNHHGFEQTVTTLANKALELWPRWYGPGVGDNLAKLTFPLTEAGREILASLVKMNPKIAPMWLAAATEKAAQGLAPVVATKGFPQSDLWQLSLALGPKLEALAYLVNWDCQPLEPMGWKRALNIIHRIVKVDTVIFLPSYFNEKPLLKLLAKKASIAGVPSEDPDDDQAANAPNKAGLNPKWRRQLAESLAGRVGLKGLFQPNVKLGSLNKKPVIADFLGPRRLVVLVDHFAASADEATFFETNRLDYYLSSKGFRVLRLSDQEIKLDVSAAVDKMARLALPIKNAVWFPQKYQPLDNPQEYNPAAAHLAIYLHRHKKIKNLFSYNKNLIINEQKIVAPLIWLEGSLVIIIDRKPKALKLSAFLAERERDYLLTMAGFAIGRLTEFEIINNPTRAVKKIAHLVELAKKPVKEF
ncbi:MAG: hypothetical protein LBT86_08645 [Deltaproteobacteria bacterium]|jgi:very-short-patch-repair endonuclease|nr:hypothetical protein [Deltaproteobacteria bacterium]